MNQIKKWITILVVVAVVAAGVVYGKRLLSRATSSDSATTQVYTASTGNLVSTISPTGQVEAVTSESLHYDVSGVTLVALNVVAGQEVVAGDVLAQLDTAPLQLAVDDATATVLKAQEALEEAQRPYSDLDITQAQLGVAQAQTALEQAQAALDELRNPDMASAEAAVVQAQYNLDSAALNLQTTQHSSSVGKAVRDLEYAVAWHQRQLRNLQAQLAAGTTEQSKVDDESAALQELEADLAAAQASASQALSSAQDRVENAAAALADAQQALSDLHAGPDALELTQAQNKVARAEYSLAAAQEQADKVAAGPRDKNVQLAQARYDSAVASLTEAQLRLQNATMVAPFDGTVVSVGASEGDSINSNTSIVVLADLTDLQVVASIDETEITDVEVGMQATITFDSMSGQTFAGTVLEIPLESSVVNNVVTYQVPVSLEGAENADLRSGMTANVTLVTGQKEGVLVLPLLAVQESDSGTVVTLVDGSTTPVKLGIDNGTYVEIVAGLVEGDRVLVTYDTSNTQEPGASGGMFPMGGVAIGGGMGGGPMGR